MPAVEDRITQAELDIVEVRHQQRETSRHLSGAVGELSQAQRAIGLDIREIHTDIAGLGIRLDRMEEAQRAMGLDIREVRANVTDLGVRMGGVEERLGGIGATLAELLRRLPAAGNDGVTWSP